MRLVDLDKVRELFRVAETCDKCQRCNIDCGSEWLYTARDICSTLDLAEEVDAVPVVRCKDCENWSYQECVADGNCWCNKLEKFTWKNFFCADGERRDTDGEDD